MIHILLKALSIAGRASFVPTRDWNTSFPNDHSFKRNDH